VDFKVIEDIFEGVPRTVSREICLSGLQVHRVAATKWLSCLPTRAFRPR
jgi:hypothetical protein